MAVTISASAEALRITRTLDVYFATGPQQFGSGFLAGKGQLITCAHVVTNESGQRANRVSVTRPDGSKYDATVTHVEDAYDLACLNSADADKENPPSIELGLPPVGQQVLFAGVPRGVTRVSIFPGMVSAVGNGLLTRPRCDLIQIAGMINNGNSGGPLLDAQTGNVVGVITAKYVPLLQEINKLAQDLESIPQFPSNVGIGSIDFSAFVNVTIRSMWQLATVLRLVQVGTGWAVPAKYFERIGVK
jgi:S1-C subfamily serine protease